MPPADDITALLLRWSDGDGAAFDELVPVVYSELKRLARARLARESDDHTLNTTGLVHEAYLRLVDVSCVRWQDRNHFLSMAARTMRRVLLDHARRRNAHKRTPQPSAADHGDFWVVPAHEAELLIRLDEALKALEGAHPRPGSVIEMYYFGGLTQEEIAEALSLSQPTVSADLRFARAWIARELEAPSPLPWRPDDPCPGEGRPDPPPGSRS